MQVQIIQSGIMAVIKGGSQFSISTSQPLLIDASSSYDKDYPDSERLTFLWFCSEQVCKLFLLLLRVSVLLSSLRAFHALLFSQSPSFGKSCPETMQLLSSPFLNVAANSITLDDSVSKTFQFTVTMCNSFNASASASVMVLFIGSNKELPSVAIRNSDSKLSKVNTGDELLLSATVTVPPEALNTKKSYQSEPPPPYASASMVAVWSSPDFSEDILGSAAVGLVQRTVLTDTTISFNLILKPGSLSAGATYTFRLSVDQSSATVSVQTNSPPTGGKVKVLPAEVLELTSKGFILLYLTQVTN